ncbi:hypothetical protein FHU29_000414 [Hoyosella altamirensis]|uniref:DUF1707 domain-containing protein n=1 Tax=Hoyosella altamirensis TaxID=616997 RepID=A0A839RHT7_9ACTN|nr:hypothetical protein [Hoyosella altamirensis]
MSESPDHDLLLSDDERLHALNVLSEHYAAGRLNVDEFYEQSNTVASARTLDGLRESFRGLPGGVPLESVGGFIRKIQEPERLPAPKQDSDAAKGFLTAERRVGNCLTETSGQPSRVT